ncbi:MAG: hypothetical protein LBD24_02190 [Spirochaetaceae bacterium]|nr:hypothetical protein [Spirochaetaceae bacterium]
MRRPEQRLSEYHAPPLSSLRLFHKRRAKRSEQRLSEYHAPTLSSLRLFHKRRATRL